MIYCFSGTGNSRIVARYLAKHLDDRTENIGWETSPVLPSCGNETLGLVFPIYAWGLPRVVEHFLERLPECPAGDTPYIYSVMTCGDDIGRTDQLLKKILAKKGLTLASAFSIQMRNTYVCLPGFNTDSSEIVRTKEERARARMMAVTETIKRRGISMPSDLTPGSMPFLKTYILRPLFNALLVDERRFHCVARLCTHCGRCRNTCPLDNIAFSEQNMPLWGKHCTHCLACYHACPPHAIEYGFFTKHKGQVKINA